MRGYVDPAADTRGIVDPAAGFEHFTLSRVAPAPGLAWAVDRYWIVRWALPAGRAYEQKVVPHPAVHLVFEAARAEIQGIPTADFTRRLTGEDQVLGVKFQPAGFRPWLGRRVSTIVDQRLPAREVFGPTVDALAADLAVRPDLAAATGIVDDFLVGTGVRPLPMTAQVNAIVHHVARDRSVTRVDDLAARLEVSTRRLQRLFADHVGRGPKWVINRFRVHEAAEQAAGAGPGTPIDWAALAADLGYSDQSHLVRDFTRAVGTPPDRYAARQGG